MKLIDILNHHLNGGQFEYKSFDFKKAKEEYEQSDEWESQIKSYEPFAKMFNDNLEVKDKYQIPTEIRHKHSYWRKGKLRQVEFDPRGNIFRIKIGAKYAVSFYEGTNDVRLLKTNDSAK